MSRREVVLSPDRLSDRLDNATHRNGTSNIQIPLTALATANTMLGAPALLPAALRRLSCLDDTAENTRTLWQLQARSFPYLEPRIGALTGWLDRAADHEVEALGACYGVLADCDLFGSFEQAGGDLLGPVYSILRGRSGQQAAGAFYTPMSLALLIGAMATPDEGTHIAEPCCGAGGLVLGTIAAMRSAGKNPDTCTWALNDLDPLAVALAGVNMSAHGIIDVVLTCGNGLLLGTGAVGDPLLG
ncbi:N-6 DNA methylase [Tsukamurella hominis]|uniref:N-6 DNA methylase n=1 Tax=Tsukamurella hominis TaxID=1970232 RepID=UPI0039EADB8C